MTDKLKQILYKYGTTVAVSATTFLVMLISTWAMSSLYVAVRTNQQSLLNHDKVLEEIHSIALQAVDERASLKLAAEQQAKALDNHKILLEQQAKALANHDKILARISSNDQMNAQIIGNQRTIMENQTKIINGQRCLLDSLKARR